MKDKLDIANSTPRTLESVRVTEAEDVILDSRRDAESRKNSLGDCLSGLQRRAGSASPRPCAARVQGCRQEARRPPQVLTHMSE